MVDSIPIIGVETQYPCIVNPRLFLECFSHLHNVSSQLEQNPAGRLLSDLLKWSWSPPAWGGGTGFTGTCVLFQDRPSATRFPTKVTRDARATPALSEPQCSDGSIQKRERCGCHSAKPNIAARYPSCAPLRAPGPRGKSIQNHVGAVPSCRRRLRVLLCLTCVTVRY